MDEASARAERLQREMEAEVQARMSEELARMAEAEAEAERERLAALEAARQREAQRAGELGRIADLEAQLSDACAELGQVKTLASHGAQLPYAPSIHSLCACSGVDASREPTSRVRRAGGCARDRGQARGEYG